MPEVPFCQIRALVFRKLFSTILNYPETKQKKKRNKTTEKNALTRHRTGDLSITSPAFYHRTMITNEIKNSNILLKQWGLPKLWLVLIL